MPGEVLGWRTKVENGRRTWETFPPYDLDDAIERFKPEERATAFAVSSSDQGDGSSLTGDEREIVEDVNLHIAELRDWHAKGIGGIKDEIRSKADDGNLQMRFRKIRQGFAKTLRKSLDSFYHDNERNYTAHRLAERELRAFRYHNNLLDRTPTYPESVLFHFALVIVAIVVEGVANSYFFGQASDLGLLGGFFTAFLVSVANVAISMLAGVLFLRLLNHVNKIWKVVGAVGFVVILVFLGVLHLTIAHYRELLTRNPDADILAALQPMFENPFALRDMESLLLVAIGVVISAFGIYKGYTIDDRYPGYGPVYRKWKVLDEKVGEIEKDLKDRIGVAYDSAAEQSNGVVNSLRGIRKDLEMLGGDVDGFLKGSSSYYETAKSSASALLSTYRNVIQTIIDDQSRFTFDRTLLDGRGGLLVLDPDDGREEVQSMLDEEVSAISSTIDIAPQAQDELLSKLRDQMTEHTSRKYLDETMSEIGERSEESMERISG